MDIKILGPGCARCFELERKARRAVDEMGVAANVEKISDIQKIAAYHIMATPGLVIDGKVQCAGRIPSVAEIRAWIQEAEGAKT